MHRRTPTTMGVVPPPLPPWIHSRPSHSSLAGLEIGLPPSPAPSGRDMSQERPSSRMDKALPPIPRPPLENSQRRPPPNQFLSIPKSDAPAIPQKSPRRFSWVSSDVSPTAGSPLRSLRRASSSIHVPISSNSVSLHASSAAALPPSDWRKNSSTPQPLKLKQPVPVSPQTNKVAQLTGCDLFSDILPSHQRPRVRSTVSISSSLYSDGDVSPTSATSGGRKKSDDSVSSIVDSYSDWGSWAPSQEEYTSPLTSSLLPPTAKLKMHSVSPEDVGSTSTLTPQRNTRTPVPPPMPPPRNRNKQLGPPAESVTWRTSYEVLPKRMPTLEHLIEQERQNQHIELKLADEPHLSQLAQIAALQADGKSSFGNGGDERGRATIRPKASMPTILTSFHHQHIRSVSRFSDGSSDDDEDAQSIRSVASARLRNSARGVRSSFLRGISGLNRPLSRNEVRRSRFSQSSGQGTRMSSQRTSGTSAATLSPPTQNNGHKQHLSSSTTSSSQNANIYSHIPNLATTNNSRHGKPREAGFARSWSQAFKRPLRSSYFNHRPRSALGRRTSNTQRHNRMISAPANIYGDKERLSVGPPAGCEDASRGTTDLNEARRQIEATRHNVAMMLEEKATASTGGGYERGGSKMASWEQSPAVAQRRRLSAMSPGYVDGGEKMQSAEQAQAQAPVYGRRYSPFSKAQQILAEKDVTGLAPPSSVPPAPPVPHSRQDIRVPPQHIQAVDASPEDDENTTGWTGRGFRVMMDSFKAKAGMRSREEKRRDKMKKMIRVVDGKEMGSVRKPITTTPPTVQLKREPPKQDSQPPLSAKDQELSDAIQTWM